MNAKIQIIISSSFQDFNIKQIYK